MHKEKYWVYILNCDNGSYYTGYTTDLIRRYQEHLLGTLKCKYTRSFKPLSIAQAWEVVESKASAMQIEKFIKKLSRNEKTHLVSKPERLTELFACAVSLTKI